MKSLLLVVPVLSLWAAAKEPEGTSTVLGDGDARAVEGPAFPTSAASATKNEEAPASTRAEAEPRHQTVMMSPPKKPRKLKPDHEDENALKELTQQHIEQLLKFYTKVAEKLLRKEEAVAKSGSYHKLGKHDEDVVQEDRSYLSYMQNWANEHGVKPGELSPVQETTAPAAAGYGTPNYLNAASFGPPTPANNYARGLGRLFGLAYPTNSPNCCNMCQCGSNYDCGMNNMGGQGCGLAGYGAAPNAENAETEDYGQDGYGYGGYGTNTRDKLDPSAQSHLLAGFAKDLNDPNRNSFYQVSGQLEDMNQPNQPRHYSSYQQYFGNWNGYMNGCGNYGSVGNQFRPMHDVPETDLASTTEKSGVFHLVKPKISSTKAESKKSAKTSAKKLMTTTAKPVETNVTTTTSQTTSTPFTSTEPSTTLSPSTKSSNSTETS